MIEDNVPVIILGEKEFKIPLLAARQNRIIDPLIIKLVPFFAQFRDDPNAGLTQISENIYNDLLKLVYTACTRALPSYSFEEFLDLPISLEELSDAFPVISKQTGVFRENKTSVGNPAGEPHQSLQTGTI